MNYNTEVLEDTPENIQKAAHIIKTGGVVGMPTETVYGLAADALNEKAVEKIFAAKGRPADNPLIVHIADISDIAKYAALVSAAAKRLAETFMPGPITIIFPKADIIPYITSGGLDTVGIRFPANKTARALIRASGTALAAPSANISGSPSPTCAEHVFRDMNGRIPAIIDGGACAVGVESTVVCVEADNTVKILRPGFISGSDLAEAGFDVSYAKGITEPVAENEKVLSPGMKYKHYSPKADVILLKGSLEQFAEYVREHGGGSDYSLIFDNDAERFPYNYITYGNTPGENAAEVFAALRKADDLGAGRLFVRSPDRTGAGLAVYNRLLRAAAFREIIL